MKPWTHHYTKPSMNYTNVLHVLNHLDILILECYCIANNIKSLLKMLESIKQ